jgi:hypothetical protein
MVRREKVRVHHGVWWHGCAAGRGGLLALPGRGRVVGRDSSGESLAGFLLVVMTTMSEGVVLPVGSVISEPIPSTRVSTGENPVHLLDEQRRRLWRRYLVEGVVGGDISRLGGGRTATGVAVRLGAGGELKGGCRAHAAATNVVLATGGCLIFVRLAACSRLQRLALLCSCQCGVGQRRMAALAATTRWDDLTCSRLWRAVQLRCGYSGAVHRRKMAQVTTWLVGLATEAARASGATR